LANLKKRGSHFRLNQKQNEHSENNGIIWKRTKKFFKVGDPTHAYLPFLKRYSEQMGQENNRRTEIKTQVSRCTAHTGSR
jgi:hypothetical protein